jgi:hypothetical protein
MVVKDCRVSKFEFKPLLVESLNIQHVLQSSGPLVLHLTAFPYDKMDKGLKMGWLIFEHFTNPIHQGRDP